MSKEQKNLRLDKDKLKETKEFKNAIKELETRKGKSFKNTKELFVDLDK